MLFSGDKGNKQVLEESNLELMVDSVLKVADLDADGFLSYPEYQTWARKPREILELPDGSQFHI